MQENINISEIKNIYKHNYSEILEEFLKVQSEFLTGVYNRYSKDLDSANIVLYFAKNLHQQTLRQRDWDLDFNISFENFWINHQKTKQKVFKIVQISKETGLPKETTRRKIKDLLKQKTLHKSKKGLYWDPIDEHKKTYNDIVGKQLNQISKLIQIMSSYLNLKISKEKITVELKKNYSFYWFHYLSTQLQYLKMWQGKLNDLELLLIGMQCIVTFNSTNQNIKSISATSVSDITGIPRATCIRKLEKLNKMRLIKKDNSTKRFYAEFKNFFSSNFNNKEVTENTIEIFSEFYLVILKALNR